MTESKSTAPYKTEPRMGLSEHMTDAEAVKLLLDYLDTEPGFLNAPMSQRVKRLQALKIAGALPLIAYAFERGKADK